MIRPVTLALAALALAVLAAVAPGCPAPAPPGPDQPWAEPPPGTGAPSAGDPSAGSATRPMPAPDAAPPVVEAVPASGCVAAGDPSIAELERAAAKAAADAFDAELVRQKLTPASIGVHQQTLHQGLYADVQTGHERGATVKDTIDGASGTFIAGDMFWNLSGGTPGTWELVTDRHGDLFRVARSETLTATKDIALCGCPPFQCGPFGSGCPACGSTLQTMYGPLPKKAKFRGEVMIEYEVTRVTQRYAEAGGASCPPQPVCSPPP